MPTTVLSPTAEVVVICYGAAGSGNINIAHDTISLYICPLKKTQTEEIAFKTMLNEWYFVAKPNAQKLGNARNKAVYAILFRSLVHMLLSSL